VDKTFQRPATPKTTAKTPAPNPAKATKTSTRRPAS
jgi:hypothetical protein